MKLTYELRQRIENAHVIFAVRQGNETLLYGDSYLHRIIESDKSPELLICRVDVDTETEAEELAHHVCVIKSAHN